MVMTQDEIAAMQADALAGTPGEWKCFYAANGLLIGIGDEDGGGVTDPQFGLWRDGKERDANARRIARLPRVEVAVTALTAQAEADQIKIEAQAVEIARLREAMSIAGPITLEDYDWNTRCYNEDQVRKIALIRELLGVQP